ncbi:unnamed protein product [Protopolystoma xenopodis]|uniref:Uncharacterized protein n=1 Tax=Protopolystoma xenopodis TaxID=117903 RepID=A0A448WIV1_9PLAT|nr:unnamed protein product [Protopolystoma xenopodis]
MGLTQMLVYLHAERVTHHVISGSLEPVIEITFCTRDFAETAMQTFIRFHGNPLKMAFTPPVDKSLLISNSTNIASSLITDAASGCTHTSTNIPTAIDPASLPTEKLAPLDNSVSFDASSSSPKVL